MSEVKSQNNEDLGPDLEKYNGIMKIFRDTAVCPDLLGILTGTAIQRHLKYAHHPNAARVFKYAGGVVTGLSLPHAFNGKAGGLLFSGIGFGINCIGILLENDNRKVVTEITKDVDFYQKLRFSGPRSTPNANMNLSADALQPFVPGLKIQADVQHIEAPSKA